MRRTLIETQTRATRAWAERGWVCLALDDGRELRFPAEKNKRLCRATAEQLSRVELICNGTGLHWEELDEDLSVSGILEGRFGQG